MTMYEIITKKKRGIELTTEEINFAVDGFTKGEIPDYKVSAFLMAIYFKGMTPDETAALTAAMVRSGDEVDLSGIPGIKVDKHSTGGVGDKTTLIVCPVVAALGYPVAKMSGRGLGHTGGTLDKLEAIPGFNINLSGDEFMEIVKSTGICISGQSKNLAPADKKLYALRDVTATVDSIPLIAASIMSKKIAAGADSILLDVKTGSGAFMKTLEESRVLAETMTDIGNNLGRKTEAVITDMSTPLGAMIGNTLEIKEVVAILKGFRSDLNKDLVEISLVLAGKMLELAGAGNETKCLKLANEVLESGKAFEVFKKMVKAQGGDVRVIENPDLFESSAFTETIYAPEAGYINEMDSEGIGMAAMLLKAGRETPEDKIVYSSGIELLAKTGQKVEESEPIAVLYSPAKWLIREAKEKFLDSVRIGQQAPIERILVY